MPVLVDGLSVEDRGPEVILKLGSSDPILHNNHAPIQLVSSVHHFFKSEKLFDVSLLSYKPSFIVIVCHSVCFRPTFSIVSHDFPMIFMDLASFLNNFSVAPICRNVALFRMGHMTTMTTKLPSYMPDLGKLVKAMNLNFAARPGRADLEGAGDSKPALFVIFGDTHSGERLHNHRETIGK